MWRNDRRSCRRHAVEALCELAATRRETGRPKAAIRSRPARSPPPQPRAGASRSAISWRAAARTRMPITPAITPAADSACCVQEPTARRDIGPSGSPRRATPCPSGDPDHAHADAALLLRLTMHRLRPQSWVALTRRACLPLPSCYRAHPPCRALLSPSCWNHCSERTKRSGAQEWLGFARDHARPPSGGSRRTNERLASTCGRL